ncbi:MopE-related protein [Lewinella sp. W8]|uniref:MopE-related protein n=1 Tax=Lewinella sp. W8 TaxID=2528208 RepID=UPI00106801AB|nr:MopE-related protein [Lewinella sp. W8]MTB51135.1 hypothetical protein [Lewinella sp. W8]
MPRIFLFLLLTLGVNALPFAQLENAMRVNEYLGDDLGQKRNVKIAASADGTLCVAWLDNRNGYWHLYAQFVGPDRQNIGDNINLTPNSLVLEEFDLAVNSAGQFMIAWGDGRRFREVVKYTILNSDGSVVLPTTTLQTSEEDNEANFPGVAALNDGDFLLAFAGEYPDRQKIANLQRISVSDGATGAPVPLDTIDTFDDLLNFSIAVAPNGNIMVAHQRELSFRSYDIALNLFDQDFNLLRRELTANVEAGEAEFPSAVTLDDGDFALFWLDFRAESFGEVYVREISNSGNILRTPRNLGAPVGGTLSRGRYPRVARLGSGFVVSTLSQLDEYQFVSSNYSLGERTSVRGFRPFPVVVNGEVITAYLRSLTNISASPNERRVTLDYGAGNDLRFVNDDTFSAAEGVASSAFRDDGSGMVVWLGIDNGEPILYGREIGTDGNPVGDAFEIFEGISTGHDIALGPNGRWALFFQEIRDFRTYTMLNVYDGDNRRIRNHQLDDLGGTANLPRTRGVVFNATKDQYVYWDGSRTDDNQTMAVRPLNLDGNFLAPLRTVFEDEAGFTFRWVQRQNGDLVVIYEQFDDDFNYDLKAAVLNSDLQLQGEVLRVTDLPGTLRNGGRFDLTNGDGNTVWFIYQLDADDVGVDSLSDPYAFRALPPNNILSTERYLERNGSVAGLTFYRDRLQYWEDEFDEYFLGEINLDSFTVNRRQVIPQKDFREDIRFTLTDVGLSLLFRDFREPGRGQDIYHYLSPDADADGFFDLEDCDDDAPSVYPGAPEIADNGIDENCDGQDSTATTSTVLPQLTRQVSLFPNPASDLLNVKTTGGFPYRLRLFDGRGVLLREAQNATQIGVGNLPAGAYWVEILRLDRAQSSTYPVIIRR